MAGAPARSAPAAMASACSSVMTLKAAIPWRSAWAAETSSPVLTSGMLPPETSDGAGWCWIVRDGAGRFRGSGRRRCVLLDTDARQQLLVRRPVELPGRRGQHRRRRQGDRPCAAGPASCRPSTSPDSSPATAESPAPVGLPATRAGGAARQVPSGVTASRPSAPSEATTPCAPRRRASRVARSGSREPVSSASSSAFGLMRSGRAAMPAAQRFAAGVEEDGDAGGAGRADQFGVRADWTPGGRLPQRATASRCAEQLLVRRRGRRTTRRR